MGAPAHERHFLLRLLACRTAPFHEQEPAARIRAWARSRGLSCTADAHGNLQIRLRRGRAASRWFFVAHLDHPGWISTAPSKDGRIEASFWGWVDPRFMRGAPVAFWPGGKILHARLERVSRVRVGESLPAILRTEDPRVLPAGTPGGWDLPPPRIRGRRLFAPACDDLAGVGAILCAMDRIRRSRASVDITALLTRAEEVGFVGAMAAIHHRRIPASAWVVSVETSRAQPAAPLGGGAVIRVGDRARIFNAPATAFLQSVATHLHARDDRLRYASALMPGGTCEATAFGLAGLQAAALCVPLGHYHNQTDEQSIGPEFIDLGDWASLVALMAETPVHPGSPRELERTLAQRLHRRYTSLAPRLLGQ